ncbi:MAG TPA: ABC transporter substrate-binding protein [Caproiciproducens sp.]|nr:ABC transporter substrate-binding protein [Caproiciproducens sp.]
MKGTLLKKTSALLMSACLVVSIAGCNQRQTTGNTPDTSSGKNSSAWKEAETSPEKPYPELVTYTVGLTVQSNAAYPKGSKDTAENSAYTRLFRSKLNIQNKDAFEAVDGDDYNQKVSMAIASGNIPDIMSVNYSTLKQLVENDLIADLTDSYKNCAGSLMKEIYASNNDKSLQMATFDGKLYAIPTTTISPEPEMLWLRGDWMDKLKLSAPKTLSDIENILTQFVQKDPGGNGPGKTIGLALSNNFFCGTYAGGYQSNNIFTNFGAYPEQWIKGKDGKAVYGSVQPEMKQGLQLLADWYKKGLIDKAVGVRKDDDIKSLLTKGQCGSFFCGWWAPYNLEASYKMNPKIDWRCFIVPAGSDGKVTMFTKDPNQNYFVVRKGFAHPELLVKEKNISLDYNQGTSAYTDTSKEAKEYLDYVNHQYGVDPVGGFDYYDAAARAYKHISEAIDGKRKPQDMIIYENTLYQSCKKYLDDKKNNKNPDSTDWLNYQARIVASKLVNDTQVNVVEPVFFDQTPSMKLKWASLQKMENEELLKILTNAKGVDSFDGFVQSWENAGGKQITDEVNQAIKK